MDDVISLAMAAEQVAIARLGLVATWAGAVANFAVVAATVALAAMARRDARTARRDAQAARHEAEAAIWSAAHGRLLTAAQSVHDLIALIKFPRFAQMYADTSNIDALLAAPTGRLERLTVAPATDPRLHQLEEDLRQIAGAIFRDLTDVAARGGKIVEAGRMLPLRERRFETILSECQQLTPPAAGK